CFAASSFPAGGGGTADRSFTSQACVFATSFASNPAGGSAAPTAPPVTASTASIRRITHPRCRCQLVDRRAGRRGPPAVDKLTRPAAGGQAPGGLESPPPPRVKPPPVGPGRPLPLPTD